MTEGAGAEGGGVEGRAEPRVIRLFGSPSFLRLWIAQFASSFGDWVGLFAIIAIAARVSNAGSGGAAIALVLSARMVPGFFFAAVAGVFVDRWDRKRVMVLSDVGRGVVFAMLPWVDTLPGLVIVSLLLELLTLMWAPARDASVPRLVPVRYLETANSLSLVAAYGTLPVASAAFAALARVSTFLGEFDSLQEILAIYLNVFSFFLSAFLISTLALPRRVPTADAAPLRSGLRLGSAFTEMREGLSFIGQSRLVRAVILAIATGLFGGGMLVPLGPGFATKTLEGGTAAYGLLLTALGFGVVAGILGLSVIQRRLPQGRVFVAAVFGAGAAMISGAAMSSLRLAIVFVWLLGVCAGAVYVLGFTILQREVADDIRGRIFSTFNALTRLCLLLAFVLSPLLSSLFDKLSDSLVNRRVELAGIRIELPGTRLTLWFGGLVIVFAGVLALLAVRGTPDEPAA